MAREFSYSQAGVITINTVLVPQIELLDNETSVSLHLTSLGTTGVIGVQVSNNGANWVTIYMRNGASTGVVSGSLSSAGVYFNTIPLVKYLRVIMTTATTAGTTTFVCRVGKKDQSVSDNTLVLSGGTSTIGKVFQDMSATVANGPTLLYHRLVSAAASTNATSVKASAGRIAKIRGYNAKAALAYLKLYNKASAPTVGTDTPILTLALKASDVFDFGIDTLGVNFSTGIAYALTGAVADADTTALVAGDVLGLNIIYI